MSRDLLDIRMIPKERRKDLSLVLARINLFFHDLDWTGFEQYANKLSKIRDQSRRQDCEACVILHRSHLLRVTSGALPALQALEQSRETVQNAPSGSLLMVRFLAMKAFLLYFLGRQDEARLCHEDATQISATLEPNNPSALNLYYFALNSVLHNRQEWDKVSGIPVENAWQKAEAAYWNACGQNKSWVTDLEEDPKVGEAEMDFFFVLTFIKYIMCLLRTCAAPEGFYRLMAKEHGVTEESLVRVGHYLELAEEKSSNMFPRCLIYFYLAQCDFHIRSFQKTLDPRHLTEAYRWATLAKDIPSVFKEAKISRFVSEFGRCRVNYIKKLQISSSGSTSNVYNRILSGSGSSSESTTECPVRSGSGYSFGCTSNVYSGSGSSSGSTLECPVRSGSRKKRKPDSNDTYFTALSVSGGMSHMDVFKREQFENEKCEFHGQTIPKVHYFNMTTTEQMAPQTLPKNV